MHLVRVLYLINDKHFFGSADFSEGTSFFMLSCLYAKYSMELDASVLLAKEDYFEIRSLINRAMKSKPTIKHN